MKRLGLMILLFALLVGAPVTAQDTSAPLTCTAEDTAAATATALELLTGAQEQDVNAQYAAIIDARAVLAALDGVCLGLDFKGEAHDWVSDPIYVPEGIYRVKLDTIDDLISIDMVMLEGECEGSFMNELFSLATGGAETVLKSSGCTLLWQVMYATEPYAVTFEKIK